MAWNQSVLSVPLWPHPRICFLLCKSLSLSLSLKICTTTRKIIHTHVNCIQTWLRVSQKLHTTSQVVVGAIVGSVNSTLWNITWNSLLLQAFSSSFPVQIAVFTVAAASSLASAVYVLLNWFKEDRWQRNIKLKMLSFVSTFHFYCLSYIVIIITPFIKDHKFELTQKLSSLHNHIYELLIPRYCIYLHFVDVTDHQMRKLKPDP